MTPQEFDFFTRHRGGFDRQFFAHQLVPALAAYSLRNNIQPTAVEVLVRLETGEEFAITNADSPLTWVELKTEADPEESRFVHMSAIREVRFRRRAGRAAAVGFSASVVDEAHSELPPGD